MNPLQPVIRHGMNVAEMVETAIKASGPADPQIRRMIDNDQMAQQAHHISTALKMAVEAYKQKSTESGNGYGGGAEPRRGASPLMDSGLPGFGESSGYRAYQQQVINY